jgi:hypothetical protein
MPVPTESNNRHQQAARGGARHKERSLTPKLSAEIARIYAMVNPSKVVQFSDFHKPQEFSQPTQSDAKTASESDSAKIVETAGNMGLPICDIPPMNELGGKAAGNHSKAKSPKAKSSKRNRPSLTSPLSLL